MYQNTSPINFYELKANCVSRGGLFEDNSFPANNTSLFIHGSPSSSTSNKWRNIIWKRPFEITNAPKFFADGVSRHDLIQGELGNCWFIAAVGNLTLHPNLFLQVVPEDNTFERGHYCGAFHFRFWSFGQWVEVVVDDRLPCSPRGELLFMQSNDKTEFWSCLLEKAYAKFHGSYQSLSGGVASEALQDFSGGIVEVIDIQENRHKFQNQNEFDGQPSELFKVLKKAHGRQSLMTCSLHNKFGTPREVRTQSGLVEGHAYSITAVEELPVYNGAQMVHLLRIRNPWGDFEWNGAWSDRGREWESVDNYTKSRLGIVRRNDGEFWMCIEDFIQHFHHLDICHMSPDPVSNGHGMGNPTGFIPWKKMSLEGAWVRGRSAGGCMNYGSFSTNPQYFFDFTASNVDGDGDKCTVVISLIQRTENRTYTRKEGVGKFCIGFRIFRVKQYTGILGQDFFQKHSSQSLGSGSYVNSREVSARFELPTGTYVIVPSTFEPDVEGNFLLRTFSEPPPPQMDHGNPYQTHNVQWASNPPQVSYPGYPPAAVPTPMAPPQYPNYPPPPIQNYPPQLPQVPMMGMGMATYASPPQFQNPQPPMQPPSQQGQNYGWNL